MAGKAGLLAGIAVRAARRRRHPGSVDPLCRARPAAARQRALFFGIKAAVLAIVIEALLRVARRALKLPSDWWIAAAAFVALYVFDAPFPLIIRGRGDLRVLPDTAKSAHPDMLPLSRSIGAAHLSGRSPCGLRFGLFPSRR